MPTGYTSKLYDGEQPFEEFVMQCARAMVALVMMREEDADAPIPEKMEPSPYHRDALVQAEGELLKLKTMSLAEAEKKAEAQYRKRHASWQKELAAYNARMVRFRQMIEKVMAWEPPTPGHVRFKSFMLEQLTTSVDFDEGEPNEPTRRTGEEWLAIKLSNAEEAIEYHQRNWDEEVERSSSRTDWVQQLRDSLKEPEVAV